MARKYLDIRGLSMEEKFAWYDKIGCVTNVEVKEHESGFPAITIDWGDIHLLTDILSVEEWCRRRKT